MKIQYSMIKLGVVGEFFSNFSLQSAPTSGNKYNVICMSLKNYGKYKVSLYKK